MRHWKDSEGLREYKWPDKATAICPGDALAAAISPAADGESVFHPASAVGAWPSASVVVTLSELN